jgi:hypothetical protein
MPHSRIDRPDYDALLEEHLHLGTALDHLRQSAMSDLDPATLVEELKHVRERVVHHFAFEERGGYLHGALQGAVHLQDLAGDLLGQHSALLQQLDAIVAQAELLTGDSRISSEVRGELDRFLRAMQEHEHRENRLVQQAVNEDVNAID